MSSARFAIVTGASSGMAEVGFTAMMRGDGDIVSGWKNKLQAAIANVTPAGLLARQHRGMAQPTGEGGGGS